MLKVKHLGRGMMLAVVVGALVLGSIPTQAAVGPSSISGKAITAVRVTQAGGRIKLTPPELNVFVPIPGAKATISVPDRQRAILLLRFSAASGCFISNNGWCAVRIVVNGTEARPTVGLDSFFQAPIVEAPVGPDEFDKFVGVELASLDRSIGPLGPATYVVEVQWAARQGGVVGTAFFQLDNWQLTVERLSV